MALPETIAVRFTEEDAGYVTVRPVVKQSFRLAELADMVVSVTGKNAPRVQQIFRTGTVVYNGYRYWWDGFPSNENEITGTKSLACWPLFRMTTPRFISTRPRLPPSLLKSAAARSVLL